MPCDFNPLGSLLKRRFPFNTPLRRRPGQRATLQAKNLRVYPGVLLRAVVIWCDILRIYVWYIYIYTYLLTFVIKEKEKQLNAGLYAIHGCHGIYLYTWKCLIDDKADKGVSKAPFLRVQKAAELEVFWYTLTLPKTNKFPFWECIFWGKPLIQQRNSLPRWDFWLMQSDGISVGTVSFRECVPTTSDAIFPPPSTPGYNYMKYVITTINTCINYNDNVYGCFQK